jgi:lysophospholipase L1-like esterase
MSKLKRNLLITSLMLNLLFFLGGAWALKEKGGISYLKGKFEERQRGPLVKKTYTMHKRELFQTLNKEYPPGGIILVGDSLTEIGPWSELLPDIRFRNRGISGDTTRGVLNRLNDIIETEPEKIFLLIGINDLKTRVPLEETISNYAQILDELQRGCPHAIIYPQSLLPTHNDLFGANYEEVEELNEGISTLAKARKLEFLDLYPKFTIHDNQPDPACFVDGLHLTAEGYLRWAKLLAHYVGPGL